MLKIGEFFKHFNSDPVLTTPGLEGLKANAFQINKDPWAPVPLRSSETEWQAPCFKQPTVEPYYAIACVADEWVSSTPMMRHQNHPDQAAARRSASTLRVGLISHPLAVVAQPDTKMSRSVERDNKEKE